MRKVFQNLIRPMFVLVLTLLFSAAWAQNITVQLRDSDGNAVPDANTATLQYWNSGWVTLAPNDGFGNFIVPTSLLPANVKMNYKLSTEERQLAGTETSPVTFNTVTFTAIVQDGNGNTLTNPQPIYTYRQTTWYTPGFNAGVTTEILPGTYDIHMDYHTSTQQNLAVGVSLTNDPQVEVFTTVTITPKLEDCLGNVIDVANNPDWEFTHGHVGPCTSCDINTGIELLPGSEAAFMLKYKGVQVQKIGNYPPTPVINPPYIVPNVASDVVFTAPGYVVKIRTNEGNIVPNAGTATLKYYNGGWVTLAANDGNGNFYVDPAMVPLTVKMEYNWTQENRILTGLNCEEVFRTVSFTAKVEDAIGNTLTGYGFTFRKTTWHPSVTEGDWNEVLPGNLVVHMVYNCSKAVRTGVLISLANDPHTEVFTTVAITPKLQDHLGNPMDVSNDPTWQLKYGWVGPCVATLGSGVELLPGSGIGWNLIHNGSSVQKIGNYPASSTANAPWVVPNVASDLIFTAPAPTPKTEFAASGNEFNLYPNPANRVATVDYTLEEEGMVDINVYSLAGELVANIYNGNQLAGQHILEWEVNGLTNGTYIVRAIVNNTVTHKRIVIAH